MLQKQAAFVIGENRNGKNKHSKSTHRLPLQDAATGLLRGARALSAGS